MPLVHNYCQNARYQSTFQIGAHKRTRALCFLSSYDTREAIPDLRNVMNNISYIVIGPRQANLVLIAYASSEGSGEPAHPRSLARTSAARSYKQ